MKRILNERGSIFASVVKSALITESPDRVSNILNNKARNKTLFSVALKNKKEDSKQINNKRRTSHNGKKGTEMSPDSFNARTVKKTMINCLPTAAYRTLTRAYISPSVQGFTDLSTSEGD